MSVLARTALALGIGAVTLAWAVAANADDASRFGADYARFTPMAGGADACANACSSDKHCGSWSYIQPGVDGPSGECRLKSADAQANAESGAAESSAPGAGITAALRPSGGAAGYDDEMQMPMESETPEALRSIAAPINLVPPESIKSGD